MGEVAKDQCAVDAHGRLSRDMMLGSRSTSLRNWKWLKSTQAMFACGNKSARPSNTSSWIYIASQCMSESVYE